MLQRFFVDSLGGDEMSYPGGKSVNGLYQRIINEMPPHHTYIEPFLGDGALMRRKRPAIRSFGIDSDVEVLARWRGDEIESLELYCCDGIEWLKHFFRLYRFGRKTRGRCPPLPAAGTSGASADAAKAWDDTEECSAPVLVFADPPYPIGTRNSKRPIYKHELDDTRHAELLAVMKRLPCFVIVSSYDSALYRSELARWRVVRIPVTNRANGSAVECLWMNYPPPNALHDYSSLGRDRRERERIRRRARNWSQGLARLPDLERRAILDVIQQQVR